MNNSTVRPATNGVSPEASDNATLSYPVLVIGTGPAGASLACFLAFHGIKGLMIGKASGPSSTPRAHITNRAALECLRDIGLEDEVMKLATPPEHMTHTRWSHSMAGTEYARIHSWGGDPKRHGDIDAASPCKVVDYPQTLLEPMLFKYAVQHGFHCRFDVEFLEFKDEGDGVVTRLRDRLTKQIFEVRSRFLFGADGGRSEVLNQLKLPLIKQSGGGLAINVLLKADLAHLMEHRIGNLHWNLQPEVEHPWYAWACMPRMVKPWKEWIFIFFPDPAQKEGPFPATEEWVSQCRRFIGDDTPIEILDVSKWYVNEVVAEQYSNGNVFCLGDAVHRHPPFNGLGSNTCIQDSYNLAWKVSYILNGKAKRSLLDTYSIERQPVGATVIKRANDGFREHLAIWVAMGALKPTAKERKADLDELYEDSDAGRKRRKALQEAVANTEHEFHAIGIEMNQEYRSSAIYEADEPVKEEVSKMTSDPTLYYVISTYPGRRLPHAWICEKPPSAPLSTIDLAGQAGFTLITGIGGSVWKHAATAVGTKLGITIRAYSIGFGQDYHDIYSDWERRRGVVESGCVLIRPDRFVAWRAQKVIEDAEDKLLKVLQTILG